MRLKLLALPLALVATLALVGSQLTDTSAQGPGPSAGELLADGLVGSIGATIGPDGALYVAESGLGGDETTEVEGPDGSFGYPGMGGMVTRVDPETGEKTVVADGMPSLGFAPNEPGTGIIDVAFIGDDMYVLLTGSLPFAGLDEYPNGVYLVEDDGLTLVGDIGAFAMANEPIFGEAPDGNPFAMLASDDGLYVTDGNHNRIYFVALDGEVTEVAGYGNIVPTGLGMNDGTLYMTEIGVYPHTPEDGKVSTVDTETGETEVITSGYAYLIDIAWDEDGTAYVLSMGNEVDETVQAPAFPFTGKLLRLEEDNTLTVLVDGFNLVTSLDISDGDAFIVGLTGEAWKVEDVSELDEYIPPTPEPTEEPTEEPTAEPTEEPTEEPTAMPTATAVPPTATSVPPTATIPAPRPPATGSGIEGTSTTTWTLGAIALLMLAAGGSLAVSSAKRRG